MPHQKPLGSRISRIIMSGHANDHFWPSLSQSQSHRPENQRQCKFQTRFHCMTWPLCLCLFQFSVFRLPILATGIEIGQLPAPCSLLPAAGLPNEAIICGPAEHNCHPSSAWLPPGCLLVGVTYINGNRCTAKKIYIRIYKPLT